MTDMTQFTEGEWMKALGDARGERDAALVELKRTKRRLAEYRDMYDSAESEVVRLTAVVQGVRELAAEGTNDLGVAAVYAEDLRDILAGGTDTPKERTAAICGESHMLIGGGQPCQGVPGHEGKHFVDGLWWDTPKGEIQ